MDVTRFQGETVGFALGHACLGCALSAIAAVLLWRHSPALRCWVWRLGLLKGPLALLLVVPVAILAAPDPEPNFFPPSFVPPSTRAVPVKKTTPRTIVPAQSESLDLWPILYVAGAISVLAIRSNARRRVDRRMPRVVGVLRPRIVVPSDLEPSQAAMALAHEAAHLRRRDPQWSFVADLVCVAFWFAPPVWICARQMRAEAEAACDAEALILTGAPKRAYAELLLTFAGPAPANALGGPARRLSRRILMLEKTPRYLPRLTAGALVATGLFALVPWRADAQRPAAAPQPPVKSSKTASTDAELRQLKAESLALRAQLVRLKAELARAQAERGRSRANEASVKKLRVMLDKEMKEVAEKSEADAVRAAVEAQRGKIERERTVKHGEIDRQRAKELAELDAKRSLLEAKRAKMESERAVKRGEIDRQRAKELAELDAKRSLLEARRAKMESERAMKRGEIDRQLAKELAEKDKLEAKKLLTDAMRVKLDRERDAVEQKRREIEKKRKVDPPKAADPIEKAWTEDSIRKYLDLRVEPEFHPDPSDPSAEVALILKQDNMTYQIFRKKKLAGEYQYTVKTSKTIRQGKRPD